MASLPSDPWKALGVDKAADKSEIRNAYKKLVLKCHPDKVQDPTLKAQKQDEFQKVQQAYELLNDDGELAKYEEQVKLMELRKQAAMMAKNMANSSATRTTSRHFEIRTAEPRQKVSTPTGASKVYAYTSVHSRSHEEMPSRMYFDDGEKHARRTASFRDDERRDKDDRRRSRRDEDESRLRERREREIRDREKEIRERERDQAERDARRADRKRTDRERDKERKRDADDKRRHKSPYIEQYDSDDQQAFSSSKTEKKRSPSKKGYEAGERERPREKSTASRRPASPCIETVQPMPPPPTAQASAPEYVDMIDKAASYIERSKRSHTSGFSGSRAVQESFYTIPAPTPPPADAIRPPPVEDDDNLRASIRSAGRRSSHEASKSKEKLTSKFNIVEAAPKGRPAPALHKSHTTPLSVPEASSPPRAGISRSSTTPLEYANSAPHIPPKFGRTQTWGGPGGDPRHEFVAYEGEDSEDDRHHHHRPRRSGRRTRSPDLPTTRYKVDGHSRTTKVDPQYAAYGESPSGRRYMMPEPAYDAAMYPPHMKVREARSYGPADVKYSDVPYNYTTQAAHDQYSSVYA